MGNRVIYIIRESGENNFSVYHGANALSPLLRMFQAKKLQEALLRQESVSHIFEHLDYDGAYQNPRLDDADMFCNVSLLLKCRNTTRLTPSARI